MPTRIEARRHQCALFRPRQSGIQFARNERHTRVRININAISSFAVSFRNLEAADSFHLHCCCEVQDFGEGVLYENTTSADGITIGRSDGC
jgi:hypothetical protein